MYVSDLKRLRNADSRSGQVPSFVVFVLFSVMPALFPLIVPALPAESAPLSMVLKAFNLCLTSAVISITSLLNFSLAASMAVALGIPLALTKPRSPLRFLGIICLTPMGLLALAIRIKGAEVVTMLFERTIWEWDVLGVWFLPFACTVYMPIVLQGAVVCLLPAD